MKMHRVVAVAVFPGEIGAPPAPPAAGDDTSGTDETRPGYERAAGLVEAGDCEDALGILEDPNRTESGNPGVPNRLGYRS